MKPETSRRRWLLPSILLAYPFVLALRSVFPERSLNATGAMALWDHFFAFILTGYLLLASLGLGWLLLDRLKLLSKLGVVERWVFGVALGLGIHSHAFLLLGVSGAFRPSALALALGIGLLVGRDHWSQGLRDLPTILTGLRRGWNGASLISRSAAVAVVLILVPSALHTLTPPWSFDALMYHLTAPRIFLEAGRIELLPDLWQANGPLGIEMLYALGLAFGSTSVARLTHLALTVLLVASAWGFAGRHFGRAVAKLAVLVLVAIPILPIWGNIANIDSGWALFEFLGVYAAVTWMMNRERPWLYLSAILIGFAVSTKYLGLAGAATTGVLIAIGSVSSEERQPGEILRFALVAAAIGLPWYVLNLLRAGNPVYPFFLGGPGWEGERLRYLMTYLRSFGGEPKALSLALSPLWLYTRRELYTTFMSGIEFPSFLFPLALVLPVMKAPRPLRLLGLATLVRFVLWGLGSQQTRFLLPIYPSLAVATSAVMLRIKASIKLDGLKTVLVPGSLGGLLMTAALYQVIFWAMIGPSGALTGSEPKAAFLRRNSTTFGALEYFQTTSNPSDRALLLWDGQGFYCDERCVIDAEQSKWTQLVDQHHGVAEVAYQLKAMGITHLIAKVDSLNFFLQHDPEGSHTRAIDFYLDQFRPACTRNLFADEKTVVDEISC